MQLELRLKDGDMWSANEDRRFNLEYCYYRIAKPKKWYRVAKVIGTTKTVNSEEEESYAESCDDFIEWLDERKYYD